MSTENLKKSEPGPDKLRRGPGRPPITDWALAWDRCQHPYCKTPNDPHHGLGLCKQCYDREVQRAWRERRRRPWGPYREYINTGIWPE